MEWILGFGLAVVIWFLVNHFSEDPNFWQLTRQHPHEAWSFFNSKPEWHVGYKVQEMEVTGPFKVVNPYTNELVVVYCYSDQIVASQAEFARILRG